LVSARALPGASGSLPLERLQKKIAAAATGDMLSPPGKQNGNSGSLIVQRLAILVKIVFPQNGTQLATNPCVTRVYLPEHSLASLAG
jgi:hypothetical protein